MKLRNKRRVVFIKLIVVIIIIIISFLITFKVLYEYVDVKIDNNTHIDYLVKDSFSAYNLNDLKKLSSTEFLLKYTFGIDKFNTGFTSIVTSSVNEDITKDAVVYIYNTHQTEGYNKNFLEDFNINNTVYIASFILKEYLNDLGIPTIVEDNSITDILRANGWKYASSYKASRILLEDAKKNNPSLKFFIDLHRDAASYDKTMISINDKKYARVMFVVGLEHDNYSKNLALAKRLNEKVNIVAPRLSRGVVEKKGKGVNGIYNQDFNENTILIEVGGQYNYIEEVNNTLSVIAKVIYEELNEKEE